MSTHSLAQLRKAFPALDAHARSDHNAMRGAGDPTVDQRLAVLRPVETVIDRNGREVVRLSRKLSPAVLSHPELSRGLECAKRIKPRFDFDGLRGVDRAYSNTGRRVLPFRFVNPNNPAGACVEYTTDELRAEERERLGITRQQQVVLDAEHDLMLDVIEYGGQPCGVVIFHCEEWTEPDGALACPVPPVMSARRIARLVNLASQVCFWCGDRSQDPLDDYLLVSSGGFLRVFPTCSADRARLERDTDYRGLDWLVRSDDFDRSTGHPDDRWR